jgi:hypothetical protein
MRRALSGVMQCDANAEAEVMCVRTDGMRV